MSTDIRTVPTPEIPKSHDYIVVPSKVDSTLIEKHISHVLNDRFSGGGVDASGNSRAILRITQRVYKMEKSTEEGQAPHRVPNDPNVQWVIGSGDPDYIFGFRVISDGKRISFKGSMNPWSHWAKDYMRNALAEHLGAKIHGEDDKPVKVDASVIHDFLPWLKLIKPNEKLDAFYHDYMAHTPADFASIAGYRRNP
jgi:hypothetical protein